ncbi:MAG: 1-acyl-sn-glycerol-3-phosphate acyltransferase [Hyphomonadaceae bacterium]|nr:1-acyl-sn-glycerol-3-phosphate acyltransferase [Hyphomonadaceae bacterium]
MMTFVRSLVYAVWYYLTMALIGLVCMPVSLFSRDAAMSAIRLWCGAQRLGLRVFCGITTEFRGMEHLPKGAGLIAMKHQSTYDTIAPFLFIRNPGYILKKELLKLPVFGIYASRVGIPIDRAGGTKTMKKMLVDAKKGIDGGQQIIIFPEGTRQLPDTPADIKPGVIFMYNELDVPCVPVALNTGLCWQGKGFLRKPGRIVFEVLKPIEPGLARKEFTQRLKDALDPATVRLVVEGRAAQK